MANIRKGDSYLALWEPDDWQVCHWSLEASTFKSSTDEASEYNGQ